MSNQFDFLKGALIGGILGGLSGLLTAPKSGKEIRDHIAGGYNSLSEKAECLLHHFQKDKECCDEDCCDSCGCEKGECDCECEECNGCLGGHSRFIVGALAGAVFGVLASLLLAPKRGDKLREALGEKYDDIRDKIEGFASDVNKKGHDVTDQLGEWKDTLTTLVDKVSHHHGKGRGGHSQLDKVLDWAGFGLRVLQQLQGKK